MRAVEIRRFVEHLSVTDGPVYEYLAQEVLREARPDLRAFLVHASILDPVVPTLVEAAMASICHVRHPSRTSGTSSGVRMKSACSAGETSRAARSGSIRC